MCGLSIIIPVYNGAKYIFRCLDSIFKDNDIGNLEVICINDGSSDNSLELLNSYQKKEKRLKIFNQNNKGVSFSRNKGIDEASYTNLMFVDIDDFLLPNSLQSVFNEFQLKGADLIIANYNRLSRSGISSCSNLESFSFDTEQKDKFSQFLLQVDSLILGSPCMKIYNKNLLKEKKISFKENLNLYEDITFIFEYLSYVKRISISSVKLYCYDVSNENTTSKFHGEKLWYCLKFYRFHRNEIICNYIATENTKNQLLNKFNFSDSLQIYYAICTIYRKKFCNNKEQYKLLKEYNIRHFQTLGQRMNFPSGFPKLFSKFINLHPIFGHLLLSFVFRLKK